MMQAPGLGTRAIAAQRAARTQRQLAPEVRTLPAPSGGWNARDAWDIMKPEDAIELENWFPGFGKVSVRPGSLTWATLNTAESVETLVELHRSDGRHLLAAADGKLWDATAAGAVSTAEKSGFTSDRWQHVAMNDVLGLVNGSDTPQTWDGTTVADMTVQAAAGEPSLTITSLVGAHTFKSRSYFWTTGSQDFWYSAVNTLGGDLTQFPLGDVGSFGGHLVTMATWTRDGGAGMDDLAVFIMSSGEAIVYQGSDPGSADDWSLVGVFQIGEPLGRRCWTKAGGDVLIATSDGYSPLSRALAGTRGARGTTVSDKIAPAVIERVKADGDNFGWQLLHYPGGRKLLANHPRGSDFEQHVANLDTGAWCLYRNLPARCWTLYDGRPFFGADNGRIIEAETGTSDNGANVTATGVQAFNFLGSRNVEKSVRMVRPLLESGGALPLRFGLRVDFNPRLFSEVDVTLTPGGEPGGKWNVAKWNQSKWSGSSKVVAEWIGHTARGYAISPTIRVEQSSRRVAWGATSIMFDRAGYV